MIPPIAEIDLRRDLPKVREQLDAILPKMGECLYASPCAIGAMVPEEVREALDAGTPYISSLVSSGRVAMPAEQVDDAAALQDAFDSAPEYSAGFIEVLSELEAKYLPGAA